MTRAAAFTLLCLVAACGPAGMTAAPPPPAGPAVPAAADDTCGAAGRGALIGRDVTALERVLILGPVRLIRPGDAITEDFRPARINFEIDGAERIARIRCG
ncbi:I78 family peptidase inhibitor [Wenxinia marina]|uniref:Peptidase inhibitor I78 family n=1 Tax=Wenxinia marina DSM 24838 TaxID=1123501 RepID=A0A0D0QCG5_9RHOB|nr:I78 family peptidase inhibitor [Wenxinia marina]KIQ70017.1 Peptidase inhibitor I78 family [Wenxinia marina DSM 24838]GGL62889.1 hypothetical protein GCM10011392_16920 [Wenxinia marina]